MKKLFRKILINLSKTLGILLIITVISNPVFAATIDQLNQQKKDLQNSINNNKQQIKSLQDMINNLDSQTVTTQKEIYLTNQIINLRSQQISDTQAQIVQKTIELKAQKANLYETMTVYYENSNQSTLVIVIGSNSLSDAIDKTQYLEAVGGNLDDAITKINKIMADLETQNKSLEDQKASLQSQKNSLVDQQRNLNIQTSSKNQLLAQANNKQSQLKGELDNVSEAIYAERQKLGGYTTGGTGGYPYANSSTGGIDPWGFYFRQCTSYAAWYFNAVEGKAWKSFRWSGVDRSSNGGDWADLGRYLGYSVTSTPRAGAIASWPAGGINAYGHVAIVQSVNSNGTINVSEYNWVPYSYDERNNVSPAGASFIY